MSAALLVAASWAAVAVVGTIVASVDVWQRERECHAQGNLWEPRRGCLAKGNECVHGDRRIPVGAVFGVDCYACECMQYGEAVCLTGKLCDRDDDARCDPSSGACIFDPGCGEPRAYGGIAMASFTPRSYCGCDGATFHSAAPTKPYRHVGSCN